MKLINCSLEGEYEIVKIDQLSPVITARLTDLEVVVGNKLNVVRKGSKNACVLLLINNRLIAVSYEVAEKIYVKLKGDND